MENITNPWKFYDNTFEIEKNMNQESLYTLANGFIGMRGDFEEKLPSKYSKRGTYINGFYESSTIPYGESAYGFAKNTQTMLNVCDAKQIELYMEDERFSLETGEMISYYRELDMKQGIQTREVTWKSPKGKIVTIKTKNMVCMKRKHIAVRTYEVTPVNFSGKIMIWSHVDGEIKTGEETDDPRIGGSLGDGAFGIDYMKFLEENGHSMSMVKQSTKRSNLSVVCTSVNKISASTHTECVREGNRLITKYEVLAEKGKAVGLEKYISYTTNQREDQNLFEDKAVKEAMEAFKIGWEDLLKQQSSYMEDFWENADIQILGNEELTQSIRFSMFHLLQSTGRDSYTSIASKGLSGEGYGGHYFWESEAYIAPVFMMSEPDIARNILEYRYFILDKAREQARLLGHEKGALYSWRSIDGEESSAYFPGGSSQYHINGDVAFAIWRYMDATQDMDFLMKYGLEILLETARLWVDVGHFSELKGNQFCIDGVTGPDEYTAIVNNNCYTNLMARENLWNAIEAARKVKMEYPTVYESLCSRIHFEEHELETFQKAADQMYIPYDSNLKIHMQDDTFLNKKVLDLEQIPESKHPLLLHYHPMFIYRHQVCKQADLVLAEYFLPDRFTMEDKKRDYDYYEKITTHDSSLSACVFSVMAAETGDLQKAYDYFIQTIRTDLDDNQKNTKDGLHMANMAGSWSCMVHGFAGVKPLNGILHIRPVLPKEWEGYCFAIKYRGQKLTVRVSVEHTCYELKTEGNMRIKHFNKDIIVVAGKKVYIESQGV